MDGPIYLEGNSLVTVDPGVKIAINSGYKVEVDGDATIKINGTVQEPVIFDGLEDKPGYWDGVVINTQAPLTIRPAISNSL